MKSHALAKTAKIRHRAPQNLILVNPGVLQSPPQKPRPFASIFPHSEPSLPAALPRFASVAAMVADMQPEQPVHCLRPALIEQITGWFINNFPGRVMYAVKTNPDAAALKATYRAGLRDFDVASLAEIQQVRAHCPGARLFFMHPVKSREAIKAAYFEHNVRIFALDSEEELQKILEVTGHADDLTLFVRLAIPNEHAALALTRKFGVTPERAMHLMQRTREAAAKMGVCFHVGSQCMDPADYTLAVKLVANIVATAGVHIDALDVGGGFPSIYPGMVPPSLAHYMDTIRAALDTLPNRDALEIFCEPGRALVAESGSLVVRVELRKDHALYLNDGTYGSLFDAGHPGFNFPVKAVRPHNALNGEFSATLEPFHFFGPTCDSLDAMKGPFLLPADIREGDWIEIGQMGAYGATMRTKFNGFYSDTLVEVADLPLMSLFKARQA